MNLQELIAKHGFAQVDPEHVFAPLATALKVLQTKDAILLDRGAHERAICHRLAVHLEKAVNRDLKPEDAWDVDCEYNLFGSDLAAQGTVDELRKHLWVRGRTDPEGAEENHLVFPDVIVHRRDKSDNELVLEVKVLRGAVNTEELEFDLRKLVAFAARDKGLGYRHALLLVVNAPRGASLEVYAQEGSS